VVPIPGTKRMSYLEDNLGASNVSLSEADIEQIAKAMPGVSGLRYPEQHMHRVNV
jgi:aryl-alcohol dehydrogenase-like predicted oxidoreductase